MNDLTPEDLKRIRIELGLSQSEMAQVMEAKGAQIISNWERGVRNPDPMKRKIYKLFDSMPAENKTELMELLLKESA